MVDMQSLIAEIRQGKKERRKKETGQKYICPHPAMQGGHKKVKLCNSSANPQESTECLLLSHYHSVTVKL